MLVCYVLQEWRQRAPPRRQTDHTKVEIQIQRWDFAPSAHGTTAGFELRPYRRPPSLQRAPLPSTRTGEAVKIRRRAETRHPSTGNAHRLTRAWVPRLSRLAGGGVEHPEPPQHHPVAAFNGRAEALEQRLHRSPRGGTRQIRCLYRLVD